MSYIVVEGLDLSGKTTLVNKLSETYKSRIVREPFSESLESAKVRKAVVDNTINNLYATHALIGTRIELFKKLYQFAKPNSSTYLISDRSFVTSMVYQSQYPKDIEKIMQLNLETLKLYGFNILPHILVYLDVPYDIARQRLQSRQDPNSLDYKIINKDTYQRMQEKYKVALELIASNFQNTHIIKHSYDTPYENLIYMIDEIMGTIDAIPVKKFK